jgi:hypothetical protein
MTITANELLQLISKVEKLGYTWSTNEDEDGGYQIEIYWYDNEEKQVMYLYIDKNSDNYHNGSYDEFNYVMCEIDKQLNARVIDKEKEERFKQYQLNARVIDKEKEERFKQYQQQLKKLLLE